MTKPILSRTTMHWGILMTSSVKQTPSLVWRSWYTDAVPSYRGEPNRVLLFRTRAHARACVRQQWERYVKSREAAQTWGTRRFRVVRVTEQVRALKGT